MILWIHVYLSFTNYRMHDVDSLNNDTSIHDLIVVGCPSSDRGQCRVHCSEGHAERTRESQGGGKRLTSTYYSVHAVRFYFHLIIVFYQFLVLFYVLCVKYFFWLCTYTISSFFFIHISHISNLFPF